MQPQRFPGWGGYHDSCYHQLSRIVKCQYCHNNNIIYYLTFACTLVFFSERPCRNVECSEESFRTAPAPSGLDRGHELFATNQRATVDVVFRQIYFGDRRPTGPVALQLENRRLELSRLTLRLFPVHKVPLHQKAVRRPASRRRTV